MTAMIARRAVLLATIAVTLGLAAAGGWGVVECSESDRDAILALAEECVWEPFASKMSDMPSVRDQTCPDGCSCQGIGNSTVLIGRDENCRPLAFTSNGKSVGAAPNCTEVSGCRCFADRCAYSCSDINSRSCMTQFDRDQDERSDIRKFFTTKNIAIFSGAGTAALLAVLCLCCASCCCLCRNCSKGKDSDY